MTTKKALKASKEPAIIAPENRVPEYRKKRNLSQKQLAEETGIPHSHLNRIESRQRHISGVELIELARALKAPTYELLPVPGAAPTLEHYDDTRMTAATIAVLEAYAQYRAKPDPQEVADLIQFLYQRSVLKRLSVKDVRELANTHAKASKNGK